MSDPPIGRERRAPSRMKRCYAGSIIGIDLDNTLICYDELFVTLAIANGIVPANYTGRKRDIRDRIRSLPNGDVDWQRLQAQAYGPAISGAVLAPGALEFIRAARQQAAAVVIVSHKTPFSNLGSETVNLQDTAREWLHGQRVLAPDAVLEQNLYFEPTRDAKIARVAQLGCTHFIDDLEEVFDDAAVPVGVERMLFEPPPQRSPRAYRSYRSFAEIAYEFAD